MRQRETMMGSQNFASHVIKEIRCKTTYRPLHMSLRFLSMMERCRAAMFYE